MSLNEKTPVTKDQDKDWKDPFHELLKIQADASTSASLNGQILVLRDLQIHIETKIGELQNTLLKVRPFKKEETDGHK
tara:strand:+ start:858 stop:1091 length:234 start_codon:yes stop_codon:yes gene_type:complete